ncbi:MAG TPA: VWA domain-containing protein [Bryobacteraceae bacterium]
MDAKTRLGLRIGTVVFACSALCQTVPTQSQPEITSQEAPVTFSSRVNLVSVPVVVRDRAGRSIGGLRKEDFLLFDKGRLQTITKFSIEASGAAAADAIAAATETSVTSPVVGSKEAKPVLPDRYIAYLVDDIHLKSGDLLQTRQAMHRHLDEAFDSMTRAGIYTTSGIVLTDFTADKDKLHAAVNRVQPWSSGPDPQQDCPSITYYVADQLVNKFLYLDGHLFTDGQLVQMLGNHTADSLLAAAYAEASSCNGACTVGQTDQLTPGVDLCSLMAMNKLRAVTRLALTYGDRETTSALGALRDIARRLSSMPGNRNLVLVSPGFLLTRDHQSAEYDVIDQAIRANVVINTIDMRGLYTLIPGGDASQGALHTAIASTLQAGIDIAAATQAADVLADMANGTGGTFFHNDNGLKDGLNRLAARPEYVYVLGFSPQELKYDGTYHGLKVTLRNSANLDIQVRRGYWAPRHAVDSAEAAREELQEIVFSPEEVQEIPVELQTEFFKPEDFKAELTVVAHLNLQSLKFRKADDRNNDTLTMVTGLFDSNGNYVSGIQRVVEMHLRDQTLAALQSGINLKETFNVAPGRYVVRLVVRDNEGHSISARNRGVEIP